MKHLKYFESDQRDQDKTMEDLKDSLLELTDWRECMFQQQNNTGSGPAWWPGGPYIDICIRLQDDANDEMLADEFLMNKLGIDLNGQINLLEVDLEKFRNEELIKTIELLKEGIIRSNIEYEKATFSLANERWSEYVLGDDDGDDGMCYIVEVLISL